MISANPIHLDELESDILIRILIVLNAYSQLRHFEGERLNKKELREVWL